MASMWPLRSQATSLPMLTLPMKRVLGSTSTLLTGEVARADDFGVFSNMSLCINGMFCHGQLG